MWTSGGVLTSSAVTRLKGLLSFLFDGQAVPSTSTTAGAFPLSQITGVLKDCDTWYVETREPILKKICGDLLIPGDVEYLFLYKVREYIIQCLDTDGALATIVDNAANLTNGKLNATGKAALEVLLGSIFYGSYDAATETTAGAVPLSQITGVLKDCDNFVLRTKDGLWRAVCAELLIDGNTESLFTKKLLECVCAELADINFNTTPIVPAAAPVAGGAAEEQGTVKEKTGAGGDLGNAEAGGDLGNAGAGADLGKADADLGNADAELDADLGGDLGNTEAVAVVTVDAKEKASRKGDKK